MNRIAVNIFDAARTRFSPGLLDLEGDRVLSVSGDRRSDGGQLYVAPGFIDSHAHVYPGVTDLGICADDIGIKHGVHLIVDAGSAGAVTLPCFRDVLVPMLDTEVKALLHISKAGFVTKQPYVDPRLMDVDMAVDCMRENKKGFLLGIKVASSGAIVEKAGTEPIRLAAEAAERAGCILVAHYGEGPPTNEECMAFMRGGDVMTHIFHGPFNLAAAIRANRGRPVDTRWSSLPNLMWNPDGSPIPPLEQALKRGVRLDVGHGAASFCLPVAAAVVRSGFRDFSISTDLHVRNVNGAVRGMPETMSKFLSLGMTLAEVVAGVTSIAARNLGLANWCEDLARRATIFRVRRPRPDDMPLVDSYGTVMEVGERIEPVAVIRGGVLTPLAADWLGV